MERNIKKEDLEKFIFVDNLPLTKIAEHYGYVNSSGLRKVAIKLGITIPPRKGKNYPDAWRKYKKEDLERYIFEEHLSCEEIGKKYYGGVSRGTVLSAINNLGIILPNSRTNFNGYIPSYVEKYSGTLLPDTLEHANSCYKLSFDLATLQKKTYIPEIGRTCYMSDVRRDLSIRKIDFDTWECRWLLGVNPSNIFSKEWAIRKTQFYYKEQSKHLHTNDFIVNKLLEDHDYKFPGYLIKADFIKEFFESREKSILGNIYDFSNIPLIIRSSENYKISYKYHSYSGIYKTSYYNLVIVGQDPSSLLKFKQAPVASITPKSHGELLVEKYLISRKIDFDDEFSIFGNFSTRYFMVVDYIFTFNGKEYWIEYNGKQHYKNNGLFYSNNIIEFKEQLIRDYEERKYCRENNILLIEIPYLLNTYDKVEKYLDDIILSSN